MSDVRTKANNLNLAFPVPGVNNSSQGFRDNTATTQQALFQASDELDKIQITRFNFTGDAAGQSDRIGNAVVVGSGDPSLDIAFTLANVQSGPLFLDTYAQDFQLTLDAKGRVILSASTSHAIAFAPGHSAGSAITPEGTSMGSGTGTFVIPNYTFNALGRLIASGRNTINYGLQNHTLTTGALLVGGANNKSAELAPPSSQGVYGLVANGSTLSWQVLGQGTVTGVAGGTGITVNGSATAPMVNLDISKLTADANILDADELVYQDALDVAPKRLTMAELRNRIVKISADASPQLGGDLDVAGHIIYGSTSNGVLIAGSSTPVAGINVKTNAITIQAGTGGTVTLQAPSLTLNGQSWPVAAGTTGQYLTAGANGLLSWTSPQQFYQTIPNTVFVGQQGNDTTGNGSLNNPYLTITKALSQIPNGSSTLYTVMLLGGSYSEDLFIFGKKNLAFEGFFASSNSVVTGTLAFGPNVDTFQASKITWDNTARAVDNAQPIVQVLNGAQSMSFKDCQFLRGPNEKSDLPAIELNGDIVGDITFTNCTVQGKVTNNTISFNGARVVMQNCGLPTNGWTGLSVQPGSNTYINNAPLMKGVEHNGGVLLMENIGAIKPNTYTVSVVNPSLPTWESGKPKFLDVNGFEVFADDPGVTLLENDPDNDGIPEETLLLDANGIPVDDPANPGENLTTIYVQAYHSVPPTVTTFLVGLYSVADHDTGQTSAGAGADYLNRLELNNVIFYYSGEFSKLYKSGSCEWSFNRVKRRSDQDFIQGPRIAYDVQPDEGQFLAHYVATGNNLTYESDNSVVACGLIDPNAGKCFQITLTGGATVKIKTPDMTTYAPGPLTSSGEMYAEVLIIAKQDSVGGRSITFQDDLNQGISWITTSAVDTTPNGLTFYVFRYFSRVRKWVGQRMADANILKVQSRTNSSYTLTASDAGSYVRRSNSSANQVVVPNNNTVQFPIGTQIQVVQIGDGQTEVVPAAGVAINSMYGGKISAKYGRVLLTKVASNIWDLSGDLDTNATPIETVTIDNTHILVSSTTVLASGKVN